jgi:hypothetical protein
MTGVVVRVSVLSEGGGGWQVEYLGAVVILNLQE